MSLVVKTENKKRRFTMDEEMYSDPTNINKPYATTQTDARMGAQEAGEGLKVTIPRAIPHGYNNNYTVRLTYADTFRQDVTCAIAGGNSKFQIFRANSIFDPDYSGGGHQPLFRDMWASMYDHYCVLACHYTIRVWNAGVEGVTWTAVNPFKNNLSPLNVTFLTTTDVTDFVDSAMIGPIAEQKNAVTKYALPGAEHMTEFVGTLTPGDFIVDAKDADDDNTWVAQGSNPNVSRFFGIGISPMNQTFPAGITPTPIASAFIQVILHYDVQFTQVNPSLRHVQS